MVNNSTNIISAKDISKKIKDKLIESGWHSILRLYLESGDFTGIIQQLIDKVEVDKQRFCPSMGNMLKPLENIPYNTITTVLLIDHSTNVIEFADEGKPLHEGMKYGNDIIIALYNSMGTINQRPWNNQGVLILPLALTSRVGGKAHKSIWAPFIIRVIEAINKEYKDIPWVLIGKNTHDYEYDIASPNVRKIELCKPMKDNQWLQWINEVLVKNGRDSINW